MTKYRKKSLIEAEQWTGSQAMCDKYHIKFNKLGWMRMPLDITDVDGQGDTVAIKFGDYIVPTGNKNEHDAIDKEYFESQYELAEGCEHCQSKIPINQTANADFLIYLDGQDEDNPHLDIEMDDGSWFADCPINFCPKCGRKLQEVDELD